MDPLSLSPFMLPLLVNAILLGITLIYGCIEDIRERAVPVVMWYPMLVIAGPLTIWFWYTAITAGYLPYLMPFIPMILFFVISFFLFTYFNLVGMADAKALIFITLLIPCFPIVPLFGYPPFGSAPFVFLPFSVLFNAVIFNLLLPMGLFLYNILNGNRAPLPYLFLGYPVRGDMIEHSFGIVMEEFELKEGALSRRFIGIGPAIRDLVAGGKRVYTKDLKENPEQYTAERAIYRQAGTVWISYGVPFLVPITLGLVSAILVGDIFTILIRSLI